MPPAKLVGMSFGQLWPCRPFLLPVPGTLCRASSSHSSLFLPCAPPALFSGFSHPVSCSTLQGVLLSTILCFIPTLASDHFYQTFPTPPAINNPRSRFILGWGVDSLAALALLVHKACLLYTICGTGKFFIMGGLFLHCRLFILGLHPQRCS